MSAAPQETSPPASASNHSAHRLVPAHEQLAVVKLHGLGNDFLVVLEPGTGGDPDGGWHQLAQRLCRRHTGIGADGLILGGRGDAGLTFRLWNADGSEAEMSGNGMRCLAHAALDVGWVAEDVPFGVETRAGTRRVVIRRARRPGVMWASVEMGVATVGGAPERCNVGHGQLLVDLGNPHLVVLGPDPETVDVASLGPALQATVPSGINVEFVTLGPGTDELTMRVWERGVGETEACGTGACAAAVALHHWGRVGPAVTVQQSGGAAAVEIRPDGSVLLAGPSEHVADCVVRA
jgi:diaminopimelate epimerase